MDQQELNSYFHNLKDNPSKKLLKKVRACRFCEKYLPLGPRPILNFHPKSKILLAGQAPGVKVHESGLPWYDASGDRLRNWLGVSEEEFYDVKNFAIVPMGYCYPGRGKSGDLPPRKECEELWLESILSELTELKLIIAIGKYANAFYLNDKKSTIKELLQKNQKLKFRDIEVLPLAHPSPRNNIWLKKNPFFEKTVLPKIKKRIKDIIH